jgi:hypothetical protein
MRRLLLIASFSLIACSGNGGGGGSAPDGGAGKAGGGGTSGGGGGTAAMGGAGGTFGGAGGASGGAGGALGGAGGAGGEGALGGAAGSSGAGGTAGAGGAVCATNVPETIFPGAPFAFVRPIGAEVADAQIQTVREVPGAFAEATVSVTDCANLSQSQGLSGGTHRIGYATNGDPTLVGSLDQYIETQGAGVLAHGGGKPVTLYASQALQNPVWQKDLPGEPHAISNGGFVVALWNGPNPSAFTWDSISMPASSYDGYYARANGSGGVMWAHEITNGNVGIKAVDDDGTSVVQVHKHVSAGGAVSMNGQILIPAVDDNLKCTLMQVSPTGSVDWLKRIPTCGDSTTRYELTPSSNELYVVSRANVNWGNGAFSSSSLEHVLTKLDASGNVAWAKSIVTYSNNITSYGFPWLVIAEGNVAIVHGHLEAPMTFAGKTIQNTVAADDGVFFKAYESNGDARWLTGLTACNSATSAFFTKLARVHDKVALGVEVVDCTANGAKIGAFDSTTSGRANLVVFEP